MLEEVPVKKKTGKSFLLQKLMDQFYIIKKKMPN
jgi:hypothetical protein